MGRSPPRHAAGSNIGPRNARGARIVPNFKSFRISSDFVALDAFGLRPNPCIVARIIASLRWSSAGGRFWTIA